MEHNYERIHLLSSASGEGLCLNGNKPTCKELFSSSDDYMYPLPIRQI